MKIKRTMTEKGSNNKTISVKTILDFLKTSQLLFIFFWKKPNHQSQLLQ